MKNTISFLMVGMLISVGSCFGGAGVVNATMTSQSQLVSMQLYSNDVNAYESREASSVTFTGLSFDQIMLFAMMVFVAIVGLWSSYALIIIFSERYRKNRITMYSHSVMMRRHR